MKPRVFALWSVLLSAIAHAAPAFPTIRQEKVVPKAVQSLAPPKIKTLFWGVAPIGKDHAPVWVHLFKYPKRKKFNSIAEPKALELLQKQVISTGQKQKLRWRRLNHIALGNLDFESLPYWGVFLRWLRPKQKTGLISTYRTVWGTVARALES